MPRSPAKTQKSPSKSTKATSKAKIKAKDTSNEVQPTTPLSDVSNFHNNNLPPPTTPRVIDFTLALPETNNVEGDGWSSDDSFEEKITWSRHRTRVIPGGFTPRNIQEVRRRLNLAQLPEDTSPSVIKPLKDRARPSTPVKSFLAKDPSVLPSTPSPKKVMATPSRPSVTSKTPAKPVKETTKGPMILATQGGAGAKMPARPATPLRQATQVKEFTFASDARSRRSTGNVNRSPEKGRKSKVLPKDLGAKQEKRGVHEVAQDEIMEGDDGVAVRMKACEIGKASILAWGETRGRYLDE